MRRTWPLFALRPFYAVAASHCPATCGMLAALHLLEPPPPGSPRRDGQEMLVLALSPLYRWYMLFEGAWMAGRHPWHAVYVFGSYVPLFVAAVYLLLRRNCRVDQLTSGQGLPVAPPTASVHVHERK